MLYLSQDSHQELYILYKQSFSAFSVLLYFTLTSQSVKKIQLFGQFNTLLNKQMVFFDKMCQ